MRGKRPIVIIKTIAISNIYFVSIFNFIHGNVKDTTTNKVVINISELVTLIITTSLVMYGSLMGTVEPVINGFLVGFSIVLIAVVWTIFRVDIIRKWFGIETGVNYDDLRGASFAAVRWRLLPSTQGHDY